MGHAQKHHSEISPQKYGSDGMEKICLNVGGQKHETYLSTVGNLPDTRLYWIIESVVKSPDYDPETTELFFDRHPAVFAQVLNYYRTGKLHCPTDVCGPLFEQELNYWGIDEKDMEPCCWANYTQHRDAEHNLKNVLYDSPSEDPIVPSSSSDDPSEAVHLWRKIQPQVWAILDECRSSSQAKIFSFTSVLFILVSVAMFCLNTVPELATNSKWRSWFTGVETICGVWFTLEFVLRILFCPDKRAFACSWTTWIDFFAVIPFYLRLVISNHGYAINALLVIRLLRLFRFFRLIYGLQVLSHTLKASSYELILLLFMLFIPVILFSSIVFFIEDNLNHANTKFRSIPHSFWWSLITITTVGYGDMHPVSWLGKVVGCMCAICGVLIVALPVSIIGSNFTLFYMHAQARLKLPKKKSKIFLQTSSTMYSERTLPRRRAIRRKTSSRASDSCSVAFEEPRSSSVQQAPLFHNGISNTKNVASRNSIFSKDVGRLSSLAINAQGKPRQKVSTISVKIPMCNLNRDRHGGDEREGKGEVSPGMASLSPKKRVYSSFDSVYYITRQKSKSAAADSLIASPGNTDQVRSDITNSFSNEEKRNVRFSGPSNVPEMEPLLLERTDMTMKSTEDDDSDPEVIGTSTVSEQQQCVVDEEMFHEKGVSPCSQDSGDSDIEPKIDKVEEDGVKPPLSRRMRRLQRSTAIDWIKGASLLESVSETCSNYNRTPNTVRESSEKFNHNDKACLEQSVDKLHFNPRRRQSVF